MTSSITSGPNEQTDANANVTTPPLEGTVAIHRADDRARRLANVVPFPTDRRPSAPAPEPRLRTVIGDVLRDERHRQERSLADVARSAAVSLPYLSEVERGRKEISSDLLDAITRALELPLVDVLERSADRLRPRMQGGSRIQLRAA